MTKDQNDQETIRTEYRNLNCYERQARTMNTSSRFIVAVHILTTLEARSRFAHHFGREEKVTSEELANSVNTNAVVIRRILGQLQDAGLVQSKTGRNGGTTILKPADQITLREIHEAVEEGDLFHLHYSKPNPLCPIGGNIQDAVNDVFDKAHAAMLQVLATKTIADVTAEVMERAGIRAMIESGMSFDEILDELGIREAGLMAT